MYHFKVVNVAFDVGGLDFLEYFLVIIVHYSGSYTY